MARRYDRPSSSFSLPYLTILVNIFTFALLYSFGGLTGVRNNWVIFIIMSVSAYLFVSKNRLLRMLGRSMLLSTLVGIVVKGVVL